MRGLTLFGECVSGGKSFEIRRLDYRVLRARSFYGVMISVFVYVGEEGFPKIQGAACIIWRAGIVRWRTELC